MNIAEPETAPIDCMTCLVDREPAIIREVMAMGAGMADAFLADLARVTR